MNVHCPLSISLWYFLVFLFIFFWRNERKEASKWKGLMKNELFLCPLSFAVYHLQFAVQKNPIPILKKRWFSYLSPNNDFALSHLCIIYSDKFIKRHAKQNLMERTLNLMKISRIRAEFCEYTVHTLLITFPPIFFFFYILNKYQTKSIAFNRNENENENENE